MFFPPLAVCEIEHEFDCACRDCGLSAGVSGSDMASVCADNGDEDAQCGLHTRAGSPLLVAAVGELDSHPTHSCTAMQAHLE